MAEGDPLDGLPFGRARNTETQLPWDAARRLLFRNWPREPGRVLRFSDADLDSLPTPLTGPPSLSVIFRRTEEQLLIEHAGGATAAALAGRFSLFSESAWQLCREIAAKEQAAHPDILFADIGQLSDTHTDNVNRRRQVYPYEIPLNVCSRLPREAQLLPDELLLSVRDGELLLESARLGKRVIPRLPTAYNFRKNELSVFRLLCDLQYQGGQGPRSLDLEERFPGLAHYPRVCYGDTILALAKWKLGAGDLVPGEDGPALRRRLGLPRWVSMGREDQQLVFDLAQPEEADFFIACLKAGEAFSLQEYLLPDRSVRAGTRPLAGQFVAFLHHGERVYRPLPPEVQAGTGVNRSFPPGSEWLYLKLYCSPLSADGVLAEVIAPLLEEAGKGIASWFFIRYRDPEPHLRLRFRAGTLANAALLARLQAALRDLPYRDLQAATYQRELERYGPALIGEAEELFHRGSALVIAALQEGRLPPFGLALRCASGMISSFYEQDGAIAFCARAAENMLAGYSTPKNLRAGLDKKYREQKRTSRPGWPGTRRFSWSRCCNNAG